MVSYDRFQKAFIEGGSIMSQVRWMVASGSRTRIKDLSKSRNGSFIAGDINDIAPLQVNKGADFQVAFNISESIKARVEKAFLIDNQRDAERVTAAEVRQGAVQTSTSLGGIMSMLSEELVQPFIEAMIWRLKKAGKISEVANKDAKPSIITGIEALSRGQDINNLTQFAQYVASLSQIDPSIVQRLNAEELMRRGASGFNIDPKGLIKTNAEFEAEQQAAQQAQSAQQAQPEIMKMMKDQLDPSKNQPVEE
jgi:hypothetical protein